MRKSLTLIITTILIFVSCVEKHDQQKEEKEQDKIEFVDPSDISQGPILHDSLSAGQLTRIGQLYETFKEVDPTPKEQWIEDFKRDLNPESEIVIWEEMAVVYTGYLMNKVLSLEEKREVFDLILLRSMLPEDMVLEQMELNYLTREEAKQVLKLYIGLADPISVYR